MIKQGDKAPEFEGVDQDGNIIRSKDYKGKKYVIYFYPKASTPGCTAEACDLRDNENALKAKGYQIIGVSADSVQRQKNFAVKYELPFPLIADEDKKIINAFGVCDVAASLSRDTKLSGWFLHLLKKHHFGTKHCCTTSGNYTCRSTSNNNNVVTISQLFSGLCFTKCQLRRGKDKH